ncbi:MULTISPECIES: MerR family transcriptional regulator [unclassified Nocardioides]|uniref:MerR family transcriptional regulator n=1 Tax=unclassified Nocardioides TaxID=2615069 RepID=UPI0019ACEB13|nr:MerR family transcriptional regulator [Nocardioides sp.]MBC7279274.1 MerR family transcriptional regulator [Nocardioides sp.]
MTATTSSRTYSIREVATLTGLPASTLRYYESIGLIRPVSRGASSGHRVYDETDLDQLTGVSCLAAIGLSIDDMRAYVANSRLGSDGATEQIDMLTEHAARLAREAENLELRRTYVGLKTDYWRAMAAGDQARAEEIGAQAHTLADRIRSRESQ